MELNRKLIVVGTVALMSGAVGCQTGYQGQTLVATGQSTTQASGHTGADAAIGDKPHQALRNKWEAKRGATAENNSISIQSHNTFGPDNFFVATFGVDTTVGRNGRDPNRPWRTIQFAVNNATANSTINIFNGTYTGGIFVDKKLRIRNAQSSFGVNIISAAFPNNAQSAGLRGGIFLGNNADNSAIIGLNLFGNRSLADSGLFINTGASTLDVAANLITDFDNGLEASASVSSAPGTGSSNNQIDDNFLQDNTVNGVILRTGGNNLITRTFLIDNVISGLTAVNERNLRANNNEYDSVVGNSIDVRVNP